MLVVSATAPPWDRRTASGETGMRKLVAIAIFLALIFYVAWPSLSVFQMYEAVQKSDSAALERKLDLPSVKASLRPAVEVEVNKALDRSAQEGGLGQILSGPLRNEMVPKLSETTLNALVTPANIIRLAAEGGSLKSVLDGIVKAGMPGGGDAGNGAKQPGGLGGLIGKVLGRPPQDATGAIVKDVSADAPRDPAKPQPYGFGNIKHFAFTGATSFEIGFAKDAAAPAADMIARMGFTGADWKLTGLVPRVP